MKIGMLIEGLRPSSPLSQSLVSGTRYNFDGDGPEICTGDIIVAVDGWPFDQERFKNTMSATLLVACSPLDSERPLSAEPQRKPCRIC